LTAAAFPAPPLHVRSLAIFGGTFDPIHCGHLAAASASLRRFHLDAVHFVVAGLPPHKRRAPVTPYVHRCAMTALACAGKPGLVASFAEAGADFSGRATWYSSDLVRAYRERLPCGVHLYFVVGADAFLEISTWHEPQTLLDSCDFIVVSRPGFSLGALRRAIPAPLVAAGPAPRNAIPLRRSTVHVLSTVQVDISSTGIRRRAARGLSIRGLVPAAVEDYICKQALYRPTHCR
jgi:nicotinate-nucleotide adenylyltransferase